MEKMGRATYRIRPLRPDEKEGVGRPERIMIEAGIPWRSSKNSRNFRYESLAEVVAFIEGATQAEKVFLGHHNRPFEGLELQFEMGFTPHGATDTTNAEMDCKGAICCPSPYHDLHLCDAFLHGFFSSASFTSEEVKKIQETIEKKYTLKEACSVLKSFNHNKESVQELTRILKALSF